MKLVERISAVDPATGWVASFGSSLVYFSALPVATQAKIYAEGPDLAYAGGLFPMQEAEKVEGGYLCSGLWQFASGCRGADILASASPAGRIPTECHSPHSWIRPTWRSWRTGMLPE